METKKDLFIIANPAENIDVYLLELNSTMLLFSDFSATTVTESVVDYLQHNEINKIFLKAPLDYGMFLKEKLIGFNVNKEIKVVE